MSHAYAKKLGLQVQKTTIGAQKIDRFTLETFKMVIASFQIENKLRRACFFQETFLVANTSIKVVLEILFLALSNADILFTDNNLT